MNIKVDKNSVCLDLERKVGIKLLHEFFHMSCFSNYAIGADKGLTFMILLLHWFSDRGSYVICIHFILYIGRVSLQ
jgi:hypothetical protein